MDTTDSDASLAESQDYPLQAVPREKRRSAVSLYFVLTGFTFFTATMFGGGLIGVAFPFWPDLTLIIIGGNLLLGAYAAVLAWIAGHSGLNTVQMARYAFGQQGSSIVDLVLSVTQIGWYAWGCAAVALFLKERFHLDENVYTVLVIVLGLAFCWTAWIGYRGLEILSLVAVPLMVVLIAFSLYSGWQQAGGLDGLLAIPAVKSMSIGSAVTIVFGTFVSGATQVTNWARFAPRASTAVWATLVAFFLGNGLMIFTGAMGALVYGQADLVQVLILQGLLGWGVIMLFLNIWTTQDNTIYNFSVAGCTLLRSNRRRLITLGGAVIGTILALCGIYDVLPGFLTTLSVVIPPVGGILMADYLIVRKRRYPDGQVQSPLAWNFKAITALLVGALSSAILVWLDAGLPPVAGIVNAFVCFAVLERLAGTH
ncbi:MAG: cytosine permease [Leptospiraceae bacterium]|nr:cytosine permease [Leptospiraceae bacterium]